MIQICEYALLTCDASQQSSINVGVVSNATFDWLLHLKSRWNGDAPLVRLQNRHSVKLDSYVGFLQSPSGESIEVLPKTQRSQPTKDDLVRTRKQLRNMLLTSLKLKPREANAARLQHVDTPLHEWIIEQFLHELTELVRRGLRFDYEQVEEESHFIRGQLVLPKQSLQTPDRATWFHIRHDIFSPNRVGNRLLKTALNYAFRTTKSADNWRLANELNHSLADLEPYANPIPKLSRWQGGKLMQSYETVKPWCELIIEMLNPNFQRGKHKGIALMFPMERLFETYVTHWLRHSLITGATLKSQVSSEFLLTHQPFSSEPSQKWFQLKPDLLLVTDLSLSVMDTKWKLLENSLFTTEHKYGLKQSDMYQLFAYGQKYLHGQGNMMLIYPHHEGFSEPLPKFSFNESLHLWVVPFDLDTKRLINGNWNEAFLAIDNSITSCYQILKG